LFKNYYSKVTKIIPTNPTRTNHMLSQLPFQNNDFEGEISPEPPPMPGGEDQGKDQEVKNPFQPKGVTQHEGGENKTNQAAAPTVEPTRRSGRTWKPTMSEYLVILHFAGRFTEVILMGLCYLRKFLYEAPKPGTRVQVQYYLCPRV
jgi:hypothetical protein